MYGISLSNGESKNRLQLAACGFILLFMFSLLIPGALDDTGKRNVESESETLGNQNNLFSDTFLDSALSEIQRTYTIKIVIVNYEEDVIDTDVLLDGLPTERYFTTDLTDIRFFINYEFSFANTSFESDLRQVIEDNSESGPDTGTWLDTDLLLAHRDDYENPQRVFYPRDGKVIDGYAVEDWLIEHPAVEPPDLGYIFYLLNYSQYDTSGHDFEHWYDYHPIDPDSEQVQDWFRLEWDNALNPDVKFQYPGFGGRGNIYVLDPSADQWYMRWAAIWWYDSNPFDYCFNDLEDIVEFVDLETPLGIEALNEFLVEYMHDPISYVMVPEQHYPAQYVQSGTLHGLVFCMDVDAGVSVDSLRWVADAERMKVYLEELFPFIPWTVNIEYLDITDYPDWERVFQNHSYVDLDGTTNADGYAMFYQIKDEMRPLYVDVESADINVFSVVFIKKQLKMWAFDRTYTGLGGGGQTVVWQTWERYYRPDEVTPKCGVSTVQLHETGHAIGLMHTWLPPNAATDGRYHYAGDFQYGPMGYFAFHNGTSTFDQDYVQSTYLAQMHAEVWNEFEELIDLIGENETSKTASARRTARLAIASARDLFEQMNWSGCYDKLCDARAWMQRANWTLLDDVAPEIVQWGTNPTEPDFSGFQYWVVATDNLSGVESVTLHAIVDDTTEVSYICQNDGGNWTTAVPEWECNTDTRFWIEATDFGLNTATGGEFSLTVTTSTVTTTETGTETETEPPPADYSMVIIAVVTGALCAAVVIVFIKKRTPG